MSSVKEKIKAQREKELQLQNEGVIIGLKIAWVALSEIGGKFKNDENEMEVYQKMKAALEEEIEGYRKMLSVDVSVDQMKEDLKTIKGAWHKPLPKDSLAIFEDLVQETNFKKQAQETNQILDEKTRKMLFGERNENETITKNKNLYKGIGKQIAVELFSKD